MFERCLYFNTNALVRKLNARWEKAFSRFDLSPPHGYLLRLALDSPGLTQQKIAEELRVNKSTVNRFINALESKGLLMRQGSDQDQRERIVVPTRQALDIQQDLEGLGDELYSTMCQILGAENVKSFVSTARTLNDKL